MDIKDKILAGMTAIKIYLLFIGLLAHIAIVPSLIHTDIALERDTDSFYISVKKQEDIKPVKV